MSSPPRTTRTAGTSSTAPLAPHAGDSNSQSLARRVVAQGRYESVTAIRNGEQLLISLILPLLALFGIVWSGLLDTPDVRGVDVAVPGILALAVLSSAFTGQGIATGFDRRYGVLAYLSTTPLGPAGLVLGKACAVLAVLLLQVIVIGGAGLAVGWRPDWAGVLWAVLWFIIGAATFTALGLLIAGTVRPEATLALTNLLWVILGSVGGAVFPLQGSGWSTMVISWLPSAALGDGLRAAFSTGTLDVGALLVLTAWGVLATAGALRWFQWR
ncbi:ABC transporter permease [Citricoccus sp. GCM10030269]|uniref:ABC transporter permease n=1 Tax=Citricoccus sp. GCM10030269 TaxID=3273388 RepID=UPI00361AD82A